MGHNPYKHCIKPLAPIYKSLLGLIFYGKKKGKIF